MKLEQTLSFHFPKSQSFSIESFATNNDCLKPSDILAAIGMAQSEGGFGLQAFFGKLEINKADKDLSINELLKNARKLTKKNKLINSLDEKTRTNILYLTSFFSYSDYCRSAATPEARCQYCKGRGVVVDIEKSKLFNERIVKPCSRCNGLGYKKLPSSYLFRSLKIFIPTLTQSTFSRNFQPLVKALINLCFSEQIKAESLLTKIVS